jgi:hypothetical protein
MFRTIVGAGIIIVTTSKTKGAHMFRYFTVVLLLLACVPLAGCQKYTSGLTQGAARSDEAVVYSNFRSIMLAQSAYHVSTGSYGTFQQLIDGGYLDARFKGDNPVVQEYKYTMTVTEKSPDEPVASFTCNADPERTGDRAGKHFFIDSNSNDVHVNATQPAIATDEIIKP